MLTWFLLSVTQSVSSGDLIPANYRPVEVTQLVVPKYGVEGGEVRLACLYTSFHSVYSVKWYQSGREFLR